MALRIDLLVPVELLPEEGAEISAFTSRNGAPSPADLLRHYLDLTRESRLCYRLSADGIAATEAGHGCLRLQHGRFGMNGRNGGQPWLDLSPSGTDLDLGPVLADEEGVEFQLREGAEAEDFLRRFLGSFAARLNLAARGYAGTPIPLLRWWREDGDRGVVVQFCGVVLADEATLAGLRGSDGKGDGGAVPFDAALGIVLEEPEVEGRGLREMAASLVVLGVVLASAPAAEAGLFEKFRIGKAEQVGDVAPAEAGVMRVAANHRQAPAKVNRALLESAGKGDAQVIVDVGKQRAYVVVDGQVAIDTPISTARSGKHTPRGTFRITQRVREGKTSTIYGCDLPYWMRLGESAIGMHVGDLPGYPASAGCVRLPHQIAPLIFEATQSGTTVKVVDAWEPAVMVASL